MGIFNDLALVAKNLLTRNPVQTRTVGNIKVTSINGFPALLRSVEPKTGKSVQELATVTEINKPPKIGDRVSLFGCLYQRVDDTDRNGEPPIVTFVKIVSK